MTSHCLLILLALLRILITGNSGEQKRTTGIDNTGGKSLLWFKTRNSDNNHNLNDSSFGIDSDGKSLRTYFLHTNLTKALDWSTSAIKSYETDGVTLGASAWTNTSNDYVLWNFRAAPGFFDIVTYEGDDHF